MRLKIKWKVFLLALAVCLLPPPKPPIHLCGFQGSFQDAFPAKLRVVFNIGPQVLQNSFMDLDAGGLLGDLCLHARGLHAHGALYGRGNGVF